MAGNELAIRELNLLTKNKLIEIILTKKLPTDVKVSESTRKLVEDGTVDPISEPEIMKLKQDDITCKLLCAEKELVCANVEREYQKRLIAEMERSLSNQQVTISSQEYLIKMLKMNENNINKNCNVAAPPGKSQNQNKGHATMKQVVESKQNVSGKVNIDGNTWNDIVQKECDKQPDNKPNKHIQTVHYDINEENSNTTARNEWKVVTGKHYTKKGTVCTGINAPKQENIMGAPQKRWIYLGRIAGDTSEEAISEYLSIVVMVVWRPL
ncbi:uncharacterized protein LOC123307076 [Coccinella septempunctata]|uniref:uncharacterized protein LOC123307076 n=1 Tax=Coccinella septempunctata TaxID=41139 RepID=UPI001D07ED0E|nr:uncharacterized protein LOC123307076 [Coccinella septempunctata]